MADGFFGHVDTPTIFENAVSFTDFVHKLRPVRPDVEFRDAGVKCELKHFDSVDNGKGERVLVRGGSKLQLERDRGPDAYQSALVRTQRWNNSGVEDGVELEIRSPHMKSALKAVVPEFKDAPIDSKHITIRNEPRCLFHYRDELFTYGLNLPFNSEMQRHVSFLLEYMNHELNEEIYSWGVMVGLELDMPLSSTGPSLEFQNLWMAFRPRDLIFIPQEGSDTRSAVLEFDTMELSCRCQLPFCIRNHRWTITGLCIDHNSDSYGYRIVTRSIKYYSGYRPLKDLRIAPLRFRADAKEIIEIRASHAARGRKFTLLQGFHHLRHSGVATVLGRDRNYTLMGEEDSFPLQTTWINGRIVIDPETFAEARPAHEVDFWSPRRKFEKPSASPGDFTEDELIICHYEVPGFALNEKKWGFFIVDNIDNIPINDDTFKSSLILPQKVKDMVSSLVQVHDSDQVDFDDVIAGKGKGMVFLLHGEPGVGKTLTAESVADHCKKPLFRIDASMLGLTAYSVEANLAAAFHLAEKWKCVILIDEADIFLEQRTSSDLERNSLVSVFLRVLEYYEGILFLTTNRLETFDPAFKSRVHLAIHYPPLDTGSRRSIWQTFLGKVSQSSLAHMEATGALDEFAGVELNGRQIKNIVRMAQARAVSEKEEISREFVFEGLDAMKAFDNEILGVNTGDGQRRRRRDEGDEGPANSKRRRLG